MKSKGKAISAFGAGLFLVVVMSSYAVARPTSFYELSVGKNAKWIFLRDLTKPEAVIAKFSRSQFLQLKQEMEKVEREYCAVKPDPFCA